MTNPTATTITVVEVLDKFEIEFAVVAEAIENGEFALWVGSGISRQAPNLGNLIEKAFEFIRLKAIDPLTTDAYMPALEEALNLAEIPLANVTEQLNQPLMVWPQHEEIISKLWNKYSRVLDIRIAGTSADFILWDAIDIRDAFANPSQPAAEHLCIAILVLEGAIQAIASANWDGFIESAVERLSNGIPGIMQVVVDPDQLRGPAGRARLLKFHGCIEHARREPAIFRRFLTGSHTQIMDWPQNPEFTAMRNAVVGMAIAQKTLVLGLSIQDNNLQTIFATAKNIHAWPWPCTPDAPAYIFCEDQIQQGQRDVLRQSYGASYNHDPAAVHEATLLRAWGEKVLIALVLKLITDKLARLMELCLTALGKVELGDALNPLLTELRNDIAKLAVPDPADGNRTAFVNEAIHLWSRMLSLFRSGALPSNANGYEGLSNITPALLATDQNAQAMGLGRLGIALSLLQFGKTSGLWELQKPISNNLSSGAMSARAIRDEGIDRPIFLVKSATDAISLKSQGAFSVDNAIVIHADDTWHQMINMGAGSRRVRTAPGRTGHIGETHVSLGNLIARCVDYPSLQQEFIVDMML
jgi:hypothetical protein